MNIIVCIKQVPDTAAISQVRINPQTNTLVREGISSIINPFDENAIEEGIRLREKYGGEVTILSMGPPQVEKALKDALAMGADKAILLCDRAFAGADTLATSYTLSCAIKKIKVFDLILFGKQAIDGDTAQVGPGVAEHLGLPQVTYARRIEIENGKIKIERTLEDSFELVEANLPIAVTVTKEINTPRYPSLKGMMKAKTAQITVWGLKDMEMDPNRVGLTGSTTQVVKIFNPEMRKKGEMLQGAADEIAAALVGKLRDSKVL
jgi:electron transfer flavoprotein beta subunit